MTARLVLLTTMVLGILAGCGQKGPLYRPDEAPEAESELGTERAHVVTPEAAATHHHRPSG